ncbi:AAA family ATPase [Halalkalibacter akibai]|uniref:ATP/GTP-binding protein n=1 Tax=Halalkalibacter akibai (strain ATCC 43226 / DSM 21942 / CIP 109018 / JCM 9157 / 1139) TaxID=1236973 RepID=W4QQ37_HALA3|nr:AAA family ATPase [Halalkalibacter akibai]GAE34022.1 ATP/GTP-binding protein [Halalkalibacter akibai JCM 9157]
MIIMINGAFGVGKTTIANELQKKIANTMIFDPEEVGFMLRNIVPEEIKRLEANTGDFQDLRLWKELTVEVAARMVNTYNTNLVIPMTIRKPEYLRYIQNGFKKIDKETYHFCLTASEGTIYKRLRNRGETEGNWCFQQTEKCLTAFKSFDFGEYIDTDGVSISTIVAAIKRATLA